MTHSVMQEHWGGVEKTCQKAIEKPHFRKHTSVDVVPDTIFATKSAGIANTVQRQDSGID